jgi:drug/metabolite transporter (DMT)-like permease
MFLVAAGVLLGTGGFLGTLLARATGLTPTAVAVYRLGVGGLVLIAVLAAVRRPLPRGRQAIRRLLAVGALALGLAGLLLPRGVVDLGQPGHAHRHRVHARPGAGR